MTLLATPNERFGLRKPGRRWLLTCVGATMLLSACDREPTTIDHFTAHPGHVAHWGYDTEDGPDRWGDMDPAWTLCAEGQQQSPIDLSNASVTALPRVEIQLPSDSAVAMLNQVGVIDALDNGHTMQINTDRAERMSVDGKEYSLVQFHFHAPSEHTVDGSHFPMEIHFVHQADDGALAVVGVFVEEGAANPGIAPLWAQLSTAPGSETTVLVPPAFAESLITGKPSGAYHYVGSLTTPPCSEGVMWYMRKIPTQFSSEQIEAFTAVYDHNNRPVQALADRIVYLDESPAIVHR